MADRVEIVLVSYVNRSGSTFLLSLLDTDPRVMACPEADILVRLFLRDPDRSYTEAEKKVLLELLKQDRKMQNWSLPDNSLKKSLNEARAGDIFCSLLTEYAASRKTDVESIVFKATEIIRFAGTLLTDPFKFRHPLRIAVLVRDPRAVYHSQKNTYVPHRKKIMNRNPIRLAQQWNFLVNQTDLLLRKSNRFYRIRYEDLTRDPVGEVLKFLSGFMPAETSSYYDRIPPEERAMHENIKRPPDPARIDQWKAYTGRHEIMMIEQACREGMLQLGYEAGVSHPDVITHIRSLMFSVDLAWFGMKRRLLKLLRRQNPLKGIP